MHYKLNKKYVRFLELRKFTINTNYRIFKHNLLNNYIFKKVMKKLANIGVFATYSRIKEIYLTSGYGHWTLMIAKKEYNLDSTSDLIRAKRELSYWI